jgi:hypothetical protein
VLSVELQLWGSREAALPEATGLAFRVRTRPPPPPATMRRSSTNPPQRSGGSRWNAAMSAPGSPTAYCHRRFRTCVSRDIKRHRERSRRTTRPGTRTRVSTLGRRRRRPRCAAHRESAPTRGRSAAEDSDERGGVTLASSVRVHPGEPDRTPGTSMRWRQFERRECIRQNPAATTRFENRTARGGWTSALASARGRLRRRNDAQGDVGVGYSNRRRLQPPPKC